jgi:hypothetical protein
MLAKLSAVAAGSLLALASYASADAIDHEFAQWQHRSIDSDLFTFFTVRKAEKTCSRLLEY